MKPIRLALKGIWDDDAGAAPGKIAVVPIPMGNMEEEHGRDGTELGDHLLLVSDEYEWDGAVHAYTLETEALLWTVGGDSYVEPNTGKKYGAWHLGSSLVIDSVQDAEGRIGGLAGTVCVRASERPTIWCFDAITGEIRFVTDVIDAHCQAGFLP